MTHSQSIHITGCPAVELIKSFDIGDCFDPSKLHKKYKDPINILPGEKYFLVLMHPNTINNNDVNMQAVIQAIQFFDDYKVILFYPNVDASRDNILNAINRHRKNFIIFKHIPLIDFVTMMAHCSCMVTNSSAGIREAASFGTPVVNVGDRQYCREKNDNTITCKCEVDTIKKAISKSLNVGKYPKFNVYYKKGSAMLIASFIENFLRKKR